MLLRIAITLAMLFGSVGAEDRRPKKSENAAGTGEQGRTEHTPPSHDPVPRSPAVHCINVKGIDYDLAPILATRSAEWTWPGMTEASLRSHLRTDHGITGIERLSFTTVKKIHAVYHEREAATVKRSVPPVTIPRAVSNCPGGVCPQYQSQSTRWLFRRSR